MRGRKCLKKLEQPEEKWVNDCHFVEADYSTRIRYRGTIEHKTSSNLKSTLDLRKGQSFSLFGERWHLLCIVSMVVLGNRLSEGAQGTRLRVEA